MALADPDVSHALIVFVITVAQTLWIRRMNRPVKEQIGAVYSAVNSGRMERIEADLAAVKAAIAEKKA